jgi:putative SOS response-associated peptidase YedK
MCGRFTADIEEQDFLAQFMEVMLKSEIKPNYNAAPTQEILNIRQSDGQQVGEYLRWGFKAPWGKRPLLINAQSETVYEKRTFAKAARERRCLVVADGFIEWQRKGDQKKKTPYHFKVKDQKVIAFAGIWFPAIDDDAIETVILTVSPNKLVGDFHDRMPVILSDSDLQNEWLKEDIASFEEMEHLLKPFPADQMEVFELGTDLNNSANNKREFLQPIS